MPKGVAVSCLVTLGCVAAFLFVVDRVLIWCELRGWISYRLSPRPVHTAIGNTLLAIEEMYRPSRRHVIEMRLEDAVRREEDDDGAGRAGGDEFSWGDPKQDGDDPKSPD
jgi:hypothetical protein